MDKSKQNGLLDAYLTDKWKRTSSLANEYALILDAASLKTTEMLLKSNHFAENQIFIPNYSICKTLVENAKKRGYNKLHIIDAAAAAVIFDFTIMPGNLFRFVYLDYTAVWTGNRSKKPLCVPEEEIIQLFDRRRFYDRSVLALTLTRRDKKLGDEMVKTTKEAIFKAAQRNQYQIEDIVEYEYRSETKANMVLIYALVISEDLSDLQNEEHVEEAERNQVRIIKVLLHSTFQIF